VSSTDSGTNAMSVRVARFLERRRVLVLPALYP
jgi:hypothetical protein